MRHALKKRDDWSQESHEYDYYNKISYNINLL